MRFQSKINLLRKQLVSEGMPLRILHYQTKMKRGYLLTINPSIVGIIWHLLNQMSNDLVTMEIEIDGVFCSSTDCAPEHIDIELFGLI